MLFEILIFYDLGDVDFQRFWGAGGLPVAPRWSPEAPGRLSDFFLFIFTFVNLWARTTWSSPRGSPRPTRVILN